MAFYISPSVNIIERDLSTYASAVATSVAGYVGRATKGPVWQRTLITTERDFTELFGTPTEDNYEDFFTAAGFLSLGRTLYFNRVVQKSVAKNSEINVTTSSAISGTGEYVEFHSSSNILNSSGIDYSPTFGSNKLEIFAKYPGAYGNTDFKVALINYTDYGTISTSPSLSGYGTYISDPPQSSDEFILITSTLNADGTYTITDVFRLSTTQNKKDSFGNNIYVNEKVNKSSRYLMAFNNTGITGQPYSFAEKTLGGGVDGLPLEADIISGYDLFSNSEEFDVNILIGGGNTSVTIANKIITICESRKDCFGVLDFPKSDLVSVANISTAINNILSYRSSNLNANTSYAAIYANWFQIKDRYNDVDRWVPSSGLVAGSYAYTDFTTEPWFAPAGFTRGTIKNVTQLAINPSAGYRDILYNKQINPIVSFHGEGMVIWGQKTLQNSPSAFDRVNVRRLFIVLEKTIATLAKRYVFEQNDEFTRSLLKNSIAPFLRDVKGRRGIYDYAVDVSSAVNTPEVIDKNILMCDIYITPTKAAENIVLRFNATKTGVNFTELFGK